MGIVSKLKTSVKPTQRYHLNELKKISPFKTQVENRMKKKKKKKEIGGESLRTLRHGIATAI